MSIELYEGILEVLVSIIVFYLSFVYSIKKFKKRESLTFFLLVATVF